MAAAESSTLKTCRWCKNEKPLTEFTKDKNRSDGFYVWCRDCKKQKAAQYYKQNPQSVIDRVNAWRRKHWNDLKPKFLEYRHRRMAREKSAGGDHTAEDVQRLLRAQNYKCASCASSVRRAFHVDHIQPLSRGGSNSVENIQVLCPRCNLTKSAKDPIAWANELGRLL